MSNNYIFCKIFVLLFFSFLSVSCGINNVNTKTASTTNNNIVITSPERVVNIKEGETFRFVVKLNRASTTDITFDWSVQHISTSAEDFTGALTGTQLIRAGDTTTTISIDTSDDSVYETDETFSLNITKVTGATPSSLTASGRIIDNDPQPSMSLLRFEQVDSTTTEGASLNYRLELNRASTTDITFDWSVQHISTSAEDFTGALTGTQLIRAGDTTATISIDTSDDSVYETDETFSLNITKVTGTAPSSLVARGRIIDNDPQPSMSLLRFEQVDSTTTEGASLNYRLELNRASTTDITFDWSVQHISTSAEDFTGALTGTQLIRAGDTTTTISIDTSDDSVYETDETFSLNITKVTGAAPSSLVARGRIIDNDPQPSMSLLRFEQVDSTTTEGASLNYRLQLNRASTTDITFDWSVQHISTSAEDFTGALTGTQLIRAGDTTTTISIDTSDDSVYETDETFSLNITKVTGATPSSLVARGRIIDNDPQPSMSLLRFKQVDSTTTEGASLNYRLELNRASTTDITFDWSVQHISTSAEDFTGALTGTQLIRAGDTTTTISIDTSDDSVYETDETFSLNITKVTGAAPSSLVARGRIIDNDPQPSMSLLRFEQVDSTTTEGASLNYRLELNRASTTDITFDWSVQHISTSAEDFTGALTGTQLIRAGDTTTTISIDTSDDSVYETDETFSLNITKVTGAAPSSLVARGRIIDNDPQSSLVLLSFEQNYLAATEDASLNYRLQISKASTTNVSFDWSVQHISTSAEDFTGALTGTQLIRAGDTTTTISIDTSDDSVYETDETFSLNITKVTGATPSSLVASGRIIDNDPQPSIALLRFEQVDSTTTEGASFNYRLELNRASTTDITFDWSVQHISTSAEDFTGALTGTQLIRAGDTTTTISIDTSDDSVYETDETFSLNITKVTGATPSSLTASGRIIDNDPQPSMSLLRFEQVDSTTTEGASLNYRLELNRASTTDITFDWSVQHISTSAEDFTGALTGTQLIRAGDTTATISIDTSDDSVYETDETFSLNITKVTGTAPSSLVARGRIIDNDPQPSMSLLRFEQVDSTTTEGASLNYRLELNRASTTDITFDWSVQHISTSAEDFTGALTGTQLIRAGDTTTTISIDTSDDSVYETDETFSLNITKVTGAAPSSLVARGRIIDNDPQPSMSLLRFEQVDSTTTEGASLNYRLQLNRASTTDITFDWSVQHISTSAEDFTGALTGTQLIRAGDTTTTISIDTSDDSVYETDETFSLNITKVTGATPSSLVARGRIIDNDPQPSMSLLRFKQVDSTTTEGASLNYRLELNRASTTDITFDWSVQHISTSAEDFTGALTGTQLIRAGDTTTTISIDTSDDSVYETDETFSLNITKVTGAAPSSLVARGRIIDNDPQPSMSLLRFEQVDSTTTEGASLNYRLELNRASTTDITFDWSVQHISTSAEDFTGALTGTQLIRAGDTTTTISIDTSDDSVYETDETFSLNITKVTGAAPSSLVARGRIIDNDPQSSLVLLSFEQNYLAATEDASLNYRLQISKASTTNVSFDWSVQHISTSAEDFTGALTGTQLIRAGDTTTTISIDTSDDSVYETDETFSLNITKVTGAAPSSLVARGRIIDNDPQPSIALLRFEQVDSTTTEGASFNYRLELNRASTTDITFDWSVQHISTSAEDFTGALTGTQLIRAGDTTTTISIDTSDDSVYETDETFSLNITKVTGATPSSLVASGRIIDNDPQPSIALLRFEQVDSTTTEGASFNYRLELNRASTTDITFDWSVQHISTSAEDFTGALTGTQLIRAGDTTTTISIDTSDDSVYETDETFSLNITKVTGATPSSLVASGRIIDNDPQPSMSLLRFEQVDSTTTEGASLNYRLELNRASTTDITFDWSVQHISTSAEDFTGALTGTQLIRAGDTTTTISIDTSDDSVYETDETFSLNITKVTGAAPSSLVARGRIIDNDPQSSLVLLSFEQNYLAATEDASLNYRLQISKASTTNVSFDWSVQHISTSAEDFTGALTGTQLIRAGDTTTTISIDTSDDSVYETDETFSLNITKVTGAAPSSLVARGRIIDNDPQPSIALLRFEQVDSTTTEGASFNYRLELNRASTTDITFDWSVQHISTSAEDFTGALTGTQLIRAGDTTTTISIDTSDDSVYETDETFSLNITKVTGATPSSLVASGRIIDNDPQPSIALLRFEQVDSTTTEGASFNYRLELNRASTTDITFDWSVQHISTSAEDFTGALTGTQLIRAGDTTTTISIDTSDDSVYETDETFSLNITKVTGATPSSLVASGRIIDNDPQPSMSLLRFEQVDSTTTEGASLNYRLELNRASTTDITFDWSVQHISTSAEDFTGALTGTQLIRAGDTTTTISIDTSDDSVYETDETFSLNITKVTGAAPSSLVARGRIIDNDPQSSLVLLSFEQNYLAATEDASLNYRLQISKASTTNVSFDWYVQHISTSAEDFTGALTGTQLIRAGDTTTTISIDTSDDSVYETDETFSLNITKVTGATPSSLTASGRIIDNDPQPSMSLLRFKQVDSTTTEGASLNYRLELNRASTTDITFDWSVQHISTIAEDFTGALTGTQLIRAGDTTATISIDTSDDSAYEGDEDFSLNITKVTGAAPSSLVARGRIIDNDPQPSMSLLRFEQVDSTTTEGASLNYRLELNRASTTDITFDWSVQHISTSAEDFTGALTGSQLIRAGDTTTTISIDTSDDSVYETDETLSLNITKVTGAAPSSLVARGRIIDNDPQPSMSLLRFEQVDSTTTEGASLNYRLQLNRASTTDITFDWSVQHISTSAEDFTGALTGTQLIRAGDTTTTISIDTSDDSVYETDETFSLNITKVTGAAPSSLTASGRIIDNDPQPSMSLLRFKQVDSTTTEGASLNYRLELNRASTTDITFDWSVQHISTSAEDFTGALTGTQLIRAGDTTTTISIDTSDDSVYETDETFSLNITKVTGAAPSSLTASGRIIDNDPQPIMSLLRFEQVDSTTTEGASLNYRLQLNRASTTDITFDWSVQHISTSAEDFTGALTGSQLIRAGDTTTTISIDTSDDSVYETDETFSLNITKVTGAAPSSLVARGRIIDNDPQPSIALLRFEQVDSTTTEGASLNYRLQLNRASTTDITFDWSVQHISTSAEDFTGALTGSQLIRAGDTTTTISIDTSDDSVYETDETFSLNITKVTGAAPSSLVARGRIIDNDPQPSMSLLRFEQVDSTTTEGASLNYRLQLNRASTTDITFDWSVQHISTSAEDFTGALTGTQLIRAGDTTATISIDTSDDSVYETDETFSLNITKVTGATPSSLVASGRIIDNDPQPSIALLRFEQVDSTTTEGASFNYRLELNRASTTDITFDWSVQHISTSAEDFTGALTGTQLIRAGDTTTTISIDTSDDSVYETDETFSLNITNVTGAAPSSLVARGRIIDNDPQSSLVLLSFEQNYLAATEDASLNYRLQISKASTTNVSFDWYVQHISTSAEDFTGALTGTQLIRAGDTTTTISIDTSDDSVYETDETFSLNITKVTGATPSSLTASGRIIDNDPQPSMSLLRFEQVDSTTTEGASLNYRLQLNRASTTDITFDWSVQHISTSAEDFTGALTGSQLIRAGDTTATISIDTSDDSVYETDETFSLNITKVTGAAPSSLVARGRIIDNDPQPSMSLLRFEQVDSTTTEGASLNYRLQLNRASTTDITFDWSVQHISTSAEDFTGALTGTQLIRAGDTTTTISIDTSDDSVYETDETFSLNITKVTGAAPSSLVARGRIIDNDPQPSMSLLRFEQVDSTTTEGASLNYRLELNRASTTDITFDWSVQHISTSAEDFTGALTGTKKIIAGSTTTDIVIDTSDDLRPELAEDFTLHITNIRGATPDSLSTLITIAASDIGVSVDYNGNGLIDIVTQEHFDNIRHNLAGTSYKTSASDAGVKCGGSDCRGYELLANLDLSMFTNWQPIGSTSDPFTSILQGNGYSIANLAIDGGDYLGLFATLSGATIDNLVVEVASISGDSYVGALAGRVEQSAISRVQVRAVNASSKLQATGEKVGGMLGAITGTTIINVTSDLSIVGGNTDNADNVGGIVGYVSNSAISYAISSGSVFTSGRADFVGGLVGYILNNSAISYSSASGSVSSSGNGNNYYGGLVGVVDNNSAISYSSASGNVISYGILNGNYGGLVGVVDNNSAISYSSASGSVSSSGNGNEHYGGLVGVVDNNSAISYSSASGSVSSSGNANEHYGGLAGHVKRSSTISYSSASGSVSSKGNRSDRYGGLAGYVNRSSTISYSSASGSVTSSGTDSDYYGGLVGYVNYSSTISDSSASGSVSSNGNANLYYGGLVGIVDNNSAISYSSASSSVSSSGNANEYYGGLVGYVNYSSTISYSSASGSVTSSGADSDYYGGLVGFVSGQSAVSYSSASGSVISNINFVSNYYGGLVGVAFGEVRHSWSSSSVFASSAGGLVGFSLAHIGFSYALGVASYGLVAANSEIITDSYWNSETSGALEAADATDNIINIASSDTAGMLASTGSAEARIFKGFFDATDEHNRNIWTFTSGSYPIITELGVDKQAVSLAYGLLRLASPYAGVSNLDSFLGATLNNEDIELTANSYNANDTLAILDVNLLQSNSVTCAAGSGDTIMTTTGANGTTIALQKIAGSIEIEKSPSNSCEIIFSNQKTDGTLQLAAIISKGAASLTKKFEITLNTIQPIISLQPTTLSTSEGDELVFTLELNHRALRDISFAWSVQHSSTSASDFTGAISGFKTIPFRDTTATIELRINDDNLLESVENFTLNITNITGAIPDRLEASITILGSGADNNGNGLIDILTQERLGNIRHNLAGTSYKTSASDAGVKCGGSDCRGYELLGDLDLSSFANWQPIGSTSDPFTSILHGNGYSIENLVIDGGNNIGLFSALSGATIDNLVVEVASISGDSYVGALAGRAEQSAISRVQVRAVNASSKLQARGEKVGGMLGEITDTTITNVTSDLSIVGGGNKDDVDYVGGIVGYVLSSTISYAYSSGSVSAGSGADNVGGLVGELSSSTIDYSSTSGEVTSSGADSDRYGGLVGYVNHSSTISYSSASGSVTSNGNSSTYYGGLVGAIQNNSIISHSSASGSVTSNGNSSTYYGGLVGSVENNSIISHSSASGGVISNGDDNIYYGGLAGAIQNNSTISYSSASGNMNCNGDRGGNYGGLVGVVSRQSAVSYSSASGSVTSNGNHSDDYGGLVGKIFFGTVMHSWSSSSVFASSAGGLVGFSLAHIGFSYALGVASYGLVATNVGTIANSYWNSETSGALEAASANVVGTNIASSDTAGMLASTGSAGASVFADFADATDKHNRNIWTFASGHYPVITEIGVDKQAVALAYGLLRLASPYASTNTLDSFLGGTLNNENIELIANSYNANDTLAILDVNLLQSNSVTCAAGSGDTIMTTTGANGTTIALQKIAGSIEIEKSPSNSCEIIFSNQKTDGTLQLAAIISKGAASLTKKFEITLKNIQSRIALQPTKASASEGDELVFTLELNHRARRAFSFAWYLQHSSTSVEDFRGATFGDKILFAGDTTTAIRLQINDDDRPENAEDFTFNITNIRGITHNNLSASITILENDLTVDYNKNGLIDIITQERLGNIRHNLAGTSYKTSASDAGVKCGGNACRGYELLGDLDLSSFANWQPIGSENDPFTSILQGNGYSIANLAIDGGNNIGLFAALSGATIDNLVVEVVSMTGDSDVGALAGRAENSAISRVQIRAASASSKLSATGARIGGILGAITGTTIINVTSDLSIVGGNTDNADNVGGIVGYVSSSDISYAYSSGSVSVIGSDPDNVGGLVGYMQNYSTISYSSASSSVTSNGSDSWAYGGLVGRMRNNSTISYSSASGSVTSNGDNSDHYGGLVGYMTNSSVSYSSASGNVIDIESLFSWFYGGLVGYATNSGKIIHSWSSGSVGATGFVAGLIGYNNIDVKFSYVLGTILPSGFGLAETNAGTITNSYWNSETSGALTASQSKGTVTNIASSDTAGMLASTGSAEARIFKGFFEATDEHNRNIWSFASGSYPIITELGVDKQAVALAYGLLRLASPYAGVSNLDSFLGGTLNNENIELIANSYSANDTLAILDINLLQSNSVTCAAGSGDTIMTTTGANGTTIALQKIAGSIEIEKSPSNSCEIIFSNQKTDGTLQLAAIISKGAASLTKKFEITLKNIQPIISLQPTTLSTSEGDELVFTLELNHRALRDISFAWSVQHSSTSVEDFRGATFGDKILFAGDTTTAIRLQINDDDRPENAEDFTFNITNIRGITHNNLSASITILENDLDITLDYDGNGLIDIITQERLGNIRYNLAGTSYKTSASDAGVKCGGSDCRGYELLGDLDLSSFANWQPIGSQNDPFTSILQGNGYSIANLAIDGGNNIGLFAALSGATIDNLVVEVVSMTGDSDVGALAGRAENSAISRVQIRAASASSTLLATGARIGGILGRITETTITNATSDLDVVGIGGVSLAGLGGIVGYAEDSSISHAYSSASVSVGELFHSVGGLVGYMTNSRLSYSSASGSVSGGGTNENHGGLVGYMVSSSVSYSSASGSVISSGQFGQNHGGLVGFMTNSSVSYSSASGSVIDIEAYFSFLYGGLVGYATNSGKIIHSWSSSSVRALVEGSYVAGLIGSNEIDVKFSYVLGTILPSGFGLVNTNSGTITNSYWNSETSGALAAGPDSTTNIASSDTAGMLASTGSAEARIFKGFFDATDEHNRNIWSFASGSYPIITELGVDKQAVSLAYGLLRLASPYAGVSNLDSFLGGTLNNENIELVANSYNANDTLAILDVNLLQSSSAICSVGSGGSIITTTGANQVLVTLSINAENSNLYALAFNPDCSIVFDSAAVIQAGGRLQLVATITKGLASLTKKFIINFR